MRLNFTTNQKEVLRDLRIDPEQSAEHIIAHMAIIIYTLKNIIEKV